MKIEILNTPSANILMNSLRSIGYSFEASIADIIDNSISANAKNINIDFPPNDKNIYISIFDDGIGMSFTELVEAMRYGSKDKNQQRSQDDLGRFGLGLKSASLSQCRILTVVSKKDNEISSVRWDLNHIADINEWKLLKLELSEIQKLPNYEKIKSVSSGTLVIWQDFDVIAKSSGGLTFNEITSRLEQTEKHLSLVFHRFLNGYNRSKIDIFINERKIVGLDPFLEKHKKVDLKKPRTIPINDYNGDEQYITVQPVILPFQKDLTKSDIELLGGIEELNNNQGFYVYRANRLLIWGTWFRLKFNHELNKYARIKVDIPNSLDDIWEIDVKKQNAKLPSVIRNYLKSSIEDVISGSRRKNNHRAKLIEKPDTHNLWSRYQTRSKAFIYKIRKDSLVMQQLQNKVGEDAFAMFVNALEIIESAIPYHAIYTDVSTNQVDDSLDDESIANTINYAKSLVESLSKLGNTSKKEVVNKLITTEPFNNEKVVSQLSKEYRNGDH